MSGVTVVEWVRQIGTGTSDALAFGANGADMDELSTFAADILRTIGTHPGCSSDDLAEVIDLPGGIDALPGYLVDMIAAGLVVAGHGIQTGQPIPDRWHQIQLTDAGEAAIAR